MVYLMSRPPLPVVGIPDLESCQKGEADAQEEEEAEAQVYVLARLMDQ